MTRHPAKYTDSFLPVFANLLKGKKKILDPMAGTGKIGQIKKFGFDGVIYANDLEIEWVSQSIANGCDIFSLFDASDLKYEDGEFDGICTSPTYGNRMADKHNAKDSSKRNTYTHVLGRKLSEGNTGGMQWGEEYRLKHIQIYNECKRVLKKDGIMIINVKDHIRKGEIVEVSKFHKETMEKSGFRLVEAITIPVNGLGFGSNAKARVGHENIFVFQKTD